MAKKYPGDWIIRTLLFTPGHNEKYVKKAFESDADCVVLDLEDAVPEGNKEEARTAIKTFLNHGFAHKKPVFVRLNPLETGHTLNDINQVACRNLDGFVYPKAYTADDIVIFDAQLTLKEKELGLSEGHFSIIVLMETPQSILNAQEIAYSSSRNIGLLFGCEDFLTDMQGDHGPGGRSLLTARSMVAMAARAAGIVPIDTPYVQVKDFEGLQEHITQARELGFEGMLVMTPKQIEIAKEMYTPAPKDVELAQKIVKYSEEGAEENRGILVVDGVFVSPPTLKRAIKTAQRFEAIQSFENHCK